MPKKSTQKTASVKSAKAVKTTQTTKAVKTTQSTATSPADQAVKVYQQYVKQLEGNYIDLVGSVQKFLKNIRSNAEELEEKNNAQLLSNLDESLKSMR